jgi:hypothetical protein
VNYSTLKMKAARSFETLRIPIDTVSHPGRSETPAIPL